MKKDIAPKYDYNRETGEATCTLKYMNLEFVGKAKCHPEDMSLSSSMTGLTIAEMRATIKYLQFVKNCVLKPELKSLEQYYYSINKSSRYNDKGYEATMLKRQIDLKTLDLNTIKDMIKVKKEELRTYIADKNKVFKIIKEIRAEDKNG